MPVPQHSLAVPHVQLAAEASSGGVTELRVHGVGGSPPDAILGDLAAEQVSGDAIAGFYRSSDHRAEAGDRDTDRDVDRHVEVFSWGGLTSRSKIRVLWLALLPFLFANLGGWMCSPGTRASAWRFRLHRLTAGLCALALTVNAALIAVMISADVNAYQAPRAGLAGNQWWLAPLRWNFAAKHPTRQVTLGVLVVVLFVVGLLWVAKRSWRYEQVRPPYRIGKRPAGQAQEGGGHTRQGTGRPGILGRRGYGPRAQLAAPRRGRRVPSHRARCHGPGAPRRSAQRQPHRLERASARRSHHRPRGRLPRPGRARHAVHGPQPVWRHACPGRQGGENTRFGGVAADSGGCWADLLGLVRLGAASRAFGPDRGPAGDGWGDWMDRAGHRRRGGAGPGIDAARPTGQPGYAGRRPLDHADARVRFAEYLAAGRGNLGGPPGGPGNQRRCHSAVRPTRPDLPPLSDHVRDTAAGLGDAAGHRRVRGGRGGPLVAGRASCPRTWMWRTRTMRRHSGPR